MVDAHGINISGNGVLTRRNAIKALGGSGLALTAGCLNRLRSASAWPSREIEIIVPWAQDGGADRTSRAVAEAAESYTNVSWNVANQTGESGSIGMNEAANSGNSGHTIGVAAPEITLYEHLDLADLSPDDITPIMQYTEMPAALVVHENSDFSSLGEFVDYAADNPGEVSMAQSGNGSSWHLAGAAFAAEANIELDYIPHDGADPAITAVADEEVDCTIVGAPEVRTRVTEGELDALGVMHDEQLDAFPDTPAMVDEGIDIQIGSWLGHFGSGGMSTARQEEIAGVYESVYDDEEFSTFLDDNHFTKIERGPSEFREYLDEQYEYYGSLVERLDIQV